MQSPVLLVHGWGSCFHDTWEATGITSLLADASRRCIGIDLLGHGVAPKPHTPSSYSDLGERIRIALPSTPVDAVGFSLGAMALLDELVKSPRRFRRVVLAGIGDGVFNVETPENHRRILAGLRGTAPEEDNVARLFGQYAAKSSNDVEALAAVLERPRLAPYSEPDFRHVPNAVLIAVGDQDFVLPADRLGRAFANGSLRILRNTDHFKTPESFEFIDAMLTFLGA